MEVSIITADRSSEESEAWGEMQDGPICIDQYEYATGAQIRMRNSIAEGKGSFERNRYIGKQRISQTLKIIGNPAKLNTIYRDILTESTKDVLYEMKRNEDMY